jgi:hypothetical protein
MLTLETLVTQRTVVEMGALARNHGLPFNNRRQRDLIASRLFRDLCENRCLRHAYRRLTSEARDALRTLLAAGGTLAATVFRALFGTIRPYRPWADPLKPWQAPLSVAERLWYLGFIGRDGEQIALCAEVVSLLPPLPIGLPHGPCPPLPATAAEKPLLEDLAVFVGSLAMLQGKQGRGGWLSPRILKTLNRRLRLSDTTAAPSRSELHTGRLRFLHYLALVSGLITPLGKRLLPAAEAWDWFAQPPSAQFQCLREAVRHDLASRDRQWDRFRFPSVSRAQWEMLLAELDALSPGDYGLRPFIKRLRLRDPLLTADTVLSLLRGPLTWLGAVSVSADARWLRPVAEVSGPATPPATPSVVVSPSAIILSRSGLTDTRALAEVAGWATLTSDHLIVDAVAARRAQGSGLRTAEQIAAQLTRLAGQSLPDHATAQLEQWTRDGLRLTLTQQTVLASPDAALLAELRADRGLQGAFAHPLTPHHLAVQPDAVPMLARRLAKRGLLPPDSTPAVLPASAEGMTSAYAYYALRVVQMLGKAIALPLPVPGAVSDAHKDGLSAAQISQLEQMAAVATERLRTTLSTPFQNHLDLPPVPPPQTDAATIRRAVERAYGLAQPLPITYFSPYQDKLTERAITPLAPIRWEGEQGYIEAWCSLDAAPRTFRLDRIVQVK